MSAVRVLVVDDMAFYRKVLRQAAEDVPGVEVVGTASNGRIALAKLECISVDFVILDIEMPELNGLETLVEIRRRWPEIGVVIVSGQDRSATELTVEALTRGALDFVAKGGGAGADQSFTELRRSLGQLIGAFRSSRAFARASTRPGTSELPIAQAEQRRGVTEPPLESERIPLSERRLRPDFRMDAIAIAASTGGPQALGQIVPLLPAALSVPVFIVQHMLPAFTSALASSLDRNSQLPVCEAHDGQLVQPGNVYLAPGGRHMVVRARRAGSGSVHGTIGLTDGPPENGVRPAADVLFRSLAVVYRGNVLPVVMTGMGADGLQGVRALRKRGAPCLTQNEESCVVYGMPRTVCEAGLSDESLAPPFIAARLAQLASGPEAGR